MNLAYLQEDAESLLQHKHIVFIGDSVMRCVYKDLVLLLQANMYLTNAQLKAKGEMSFLGDELLMGGVLGEMVNSTKYREVRRFHGRNLMVTFYFVVKCYDEYVQGVLRDLEQMKPDVILMCSCIWDMTSYGPNAIPNYRNNIRLLFDHLDRVLMPSTFFLWMCTLPVNKKPRGGFFEPAPAKTYNPRKLHLDITAANHCARLEALYHGYSVLDMCELFRQHVHLRAPDGVHWNEIAHRRITNIYLTKLSQRWHFLAPSHRIFGLHPSQLHRCRSYTTDSMSERYDGYGNLYAPGFEFDDNCNPRYSFPPSLPRRLDNQEQSASRLLFSKAAAQNDGNNNKENKNGSNQTSSDSTDKTAPSETVIAPKTNQDDKDVAKMNTLNEGDTKMDRVNENATKGDQENGNGAMKERGSESTAKNEQIDKNVAKTGQECEMVVKSDTENASPTKTIQKEEMSDQENENTEKSEKKSATEAIQEIETAVMPEQANERVAETDQENESAVIACNNNAANANQAIECAKTDPENETAVNIKEDDENSQIIEEEIDAAAMMEQESEIAAEKGQKNGNANKESGDITVEVLNLELCIEMTEESTDAGKTSPKTEPVFMIDKECEYATKTTLDNEHITETGTGSTALESGGAVEEAQGKDTAEKICQEYGRIVDIMQESGNADKVLPTSTSIANTILNFETTVPATEGSDFATSVSQEGNTVYLECQIDSIVGEKVLGDGTKPAQCLTPKPPPSKEPSKGKKKAVKAGTANEGTSKDEETFAVPVHITSTNSPKQKYITSSAKSPKFSAFTGTVPGKEIGHTKKIAPKPTERNSIDSIKSATRASAQKRKLFVKKCYPVTAPKKRKTVHINPQHQHFRNLQRQTECQVPEGNTLGQTMPNERMGNQNSPSETQQWGFQHDGYENMPPQSWNHHRVYREHAKPIEWNGREQCEDYALESGQERLSDNYQPQYQETIINNYQPQYQGTIINNYQPPYQETVINNYQPDQETIISNCQSQWNGEQGYSDIGDWNPQAGYSDTYKQQGGCSDTYKQQGGYSDTYTFEEWNQQTIHSDGYNQQDGRRDNYTPQYWNQETNCSESYHEQEVHSGQYIPQDCIWEEDYRKSPMCQNWEDQEYQRQNDYDRLNGNQAPENHWHQVTCPQSVPQETDQYDDYAYNGQSWENGDFNMHSDMQASFDPALDSHVAPQWQRKWETGSNDIRNHDMLEEPGFTSENSAEVDMMMNSTCRFEEGTLQISHAEKKHSWSRAPKMMFDLRTLLNRKRSSTK